MHDSSFGRLIGALFQPTATFTSIAQRPTWVVALLLLVLMGTVTGLIILDRMDMEEVIRERIEQRSGQASEEDIQRGVEVAEKFGWIGALVGTLVIGPVVYLIIALVFWVIFKLLGGEFGYSTSLSVTVHAFMPTVISSLLLLPILLSRESVSPADAETGLLASNLGFFAPEEMSRSLKMLLAGVDIFSLWVLFLLSIGFALAAKVSRKTSAITVVVLWLIYLLGKAGWTSLFS